jgi:hypothetical protein
MTFLCVHLYCIDYMGRLLCQLLNMYFILFYILLFSDQTWSEHEGTPCNQIVYIRSFEYIISYIRSKISLFILIDNGRLIIWISKRNKE